MTAKKKSVEHAVKEFLDSDMTAEDLLLASDPDAPPPLKVVKPVPKPKPGTKEFDWAAEYPGEECYVFTSSEGLTIGLTKLNPVTRKPKPGKLRRLHREGGLSVMWYFIELVSTPESLTVQEELDEEDYTAMLKGWAEFAGIELSE
jgi:hypothetical protein